MAKTKFISVISEKGGVGKTTTIFNLAGSLSIKKKKEVLVVDFDPQQNLAQSFGYINDGKKTAAELIKNEVEAFPILNQSDYDTIIRHSDFGVDYIPSLVKSLNQLPHIITKDDIYAVKNAFSNEAFSKYDFIFFDCKNSLSEYLVPYILTASDYVITPAECGQYSFYGIQAIIKLVNNIKNQYNNKLNFLGIILNKYSSNIKISNLVSDTIKLGYKDCIFKTIIPYRLSQTENAVAQNKPCTIARTAGKKNTLGDIYDSLSNEFIKKIGGKK